MGYTHYWTVTERFTDAEWLKVMEGAQRVADWCKTNNIPLLFESGEPDNALYIGVEQIRFNGQGDDGHETFLLGNSFEAEFCKTARKPYDIAVCLMLLLVKKVNPKKLTVHSDGDWESDWSEARAAYKAIFGVTAKSPFRK